jgi:anti-sigma factor ChrR (cupin superfamily)
LSRPEQQTSRAHVPEFIFKDNKDIPWVSSKFADGVEVKNLGKANGRALQLVRFQPGASYPAHVHSDCEFIYVLEGEVFQNGQRLTEGCSTVASVGTVDETFVSPAGCLFLLFYGVDG